MYLDVRAILTTTWLVLLTTVTSATWAQSDGSGLADLSLFGWTQDTSLAGLMTDKYKSASGSVLYLVAFPPTEQTAAHWLDHAMPLIADVATDAGQEWSLGDSERDGTNGHATVYNTSSDDVDIASRSLRVAGRNEQEPEITRYFRVFVRQGEAVQLGILENADSDSAAKPAAAVAEAADLIQYSARLPFNEAAVMLGLDSMVGITVLPFLFQEPVTANIVAAENAPTLNIVAAANVPVARAPAAPKGWKREAFTNHVNFYPTFGKLAFGSETGHLELRLFNSKPLNGVPLDTFLADFVRGENGFTKVIERDRALMDGPYRAWDYMRVQTKRGVYLNVSYIAIRTGENSVRIIRETVTDKYHAMRNDYASGLDPIYAQVKRETAEAYRTAEEAKPTIDLMLKRIRSENREQKRARQKSAKARSNASFLASISTAPGKGIPKAQIYGVFLRSDYLERAYGGGGARQAIYVMLKDGTAYSNPSRPPSDLNVTMSRRLQKKKWVQWRKQGKGYESRTDASAPWKTLKGKLASPAPSRTMNFSGDFIQAWGDILSGTAGFSNGGLVLTAKGRFETSSFTLAGGGGITGLPAATVGVSTGKGGTQSTTSSDVAPALINNTNRDPNGTDYTGQYALDGYTAEFLTDSGKLNRTLILIPEPGSVYLEGKNYSLPEK